MKLQDIKDKALGNSTVATDPVSPLELAKQKAEEVLTAFEKSMNTIGDPTASQKENLLAKKALKDLFYSVRTVVENDIADFSEEAAKDSA